MDIKRYSNRVELGLTHNELESMLRYLFSAALAESIVQLEELPRRTKADMAINLLQYMPFSDEMEVLRQQLKMIRSEIDNKPSKG